MLLFGACESAEPNIGATIDDVQDNTTEYVGNVVTVSGEVNPVYGTAAFELGDLLVVVPSDVTIRGGGSALTTDAEGDVAQVTGTVIEYAIGTVEQDYGVDLGAYDVDYGEGQAAIIAETIYLTPTAAANYTGYPAAAVDLPVTEVVSDKVFLTDIGLGTRLPVYLVENPSQQQPVEGQVDINQGQVVSLSGSLQAMPQASALEQQWGLASEAADRLDDYTFYFRAQYAAGVPDTAPGPSN